MVKVEQRYIKILDIYTGEEFIIDSASEIIGFVDGISVDSIAPTEVVIIEPEWTSTPQGSELNVEEIRMNFEKSLQAMIDFFETKEGDK